MSHSDWQNSSPLVVDTNTALSGLIGGVTRRLLFELDRQLCYPEPSLDEIRRNRGVIQERSGLSPTAIDELLDRLFDQVTVVPEAVVVREYERAAAATSPHPDADSARQFAGRDAGDVVFLATTLAVNGDIWSDDSVFRHQDYDDWYRTEDVVDYADIDISGAQ